ncbi:hypothetical protein G6M70_16335 [Agrobacterium tumefaciens]|uniref:hypothetical protein n=1 Tax=Agrobacterium tumefaciens TaxID=358 RepID=UPI001571B113|nr:hypothetical protein [Agrobacterium tumefaciens]NSY99771.1 hypothetical protein [Agrobacterium tumefaciens]NSZ40586.1 hypothetical protein [Agrobacterium tumefaciens]NTB24785.1 hypothetical protein [Agrobacterium tumefaciens]NTB28911.1 hypothetical protein [Agrobacterium tumefaciens]NTB36954.1 hypothetical protein [Agrobacterium tumefaciens]
MKDAIKVNMPTLCIANAIDTLRVIIDRAPIATEADAITRANFSQQDQAIFWRPLDKLIVTEAPITGFEWLTGLLGIKGARNISPAEPTGCLFTDVLKDSRLQRAISEWAGRERRIRIIVHTTTSALWDMVLFLETHLGLTVYLPESSRNQALRDYVDTKSGFREIATNLGLSNGLVRIATGGSYPTAETAAGAIFNKITSGKAAIAKPDKGEASVGLNIFYPGTNYCSLLRELHSNRYLSSDLIVVEEYIEGENIIFPSVEFHVPEDGSPEHTFACSMMFSRQTELRGNFVHPNQSEEPWYSPLVETGLLIASYLQKQGYVGFFDIDCVSGASGETIMLDLNPRRTGGTHIHEFASVFLGPTYQTTHCVGALDYYADHAISLEALLEKIRPSIRSPTESLGVLPIELTGLQFGRASLLFWGNRSEEIAELKNRVEADLAVLGFKIV